MSHDPSKSPKSELIKSSAHRYQAVADAVYNFADTVLTIKIELDRDKKNNNYGICRAYPR